MGAVPFIIIKRAESTKMQSIRQQGIQEFSDCIFHNGAVRFVFRYDGDNDRVDAVRCENNYVRPAYFSVRRGNNIFEDEAPPGGVHEFNIPPGILNQMVLGIDDDELVVIVLQMQTLK